MKCTIKFRGRRKDNGQWVYGYLADEDYINDIDSIDLSSIEVLPETVAQFTGLYDIQGNEIYGNSRLRRDDSQYIYIVEWNERIGAWCIRSEEEGFLGVRPLGEWLRISYFEIIDD